MLKIKEQSNVKAITQDCMNQGFICGNRNLYCNQHLDIDIIPQIHEEIYRIAKNKEGGI